MWSLKRATKYLINVLWGQPIKLIQVVSTSEFHEYWWNDLDFIFLIPSTCCRASEASKINYFKNKVWTFWTKNFNSSLKNGYFGAIIFQEIEFFEHLKCNFKTSWPQKISIFKKHFTAKITLILMIKKMPLIFFWCWKIKHLWMTYFMFVLLRPRNKWRGQKK